MNAHDPQIAALLALSVQETSLQSDGRYTKPRTWGVYELQPVQNTQTRKYRLGNHPIRQRELQAEFGQVRQMGLFTSRSIAEQLARRLNGRL